MEFWSKLSGTPVLFWHEETQEYLVNWLGIVLPRKLALFYAAKFYHSVPLGPSVVASLIRDYGVSNVQIHEMYLKLTKRIKHENKKTDYNAHSVMSWFDTNKAIKS